jgi:hypothetical protein
VRVDAGARWSVEAVARRMRNHDFEEIAALSAYSTREEMAQHFGVNYGHHPDVIVFSNDKEPVAVGALVQGRPNVATCLFFATDAFSSIGADVTRFVRQRLFPGYREKGVHRIEAISIAGYDDMHRWLGVLGLTKEADLAGYGRNGEAFVQFSWVADSVRPARA